MPNNFTGEVQATLANVASPIDGLLVSMSADQFDHVVKGQVLGKVTLTPEAAKAALATIRADLEVMHARMSQDQRRIDQNYQELRSERMDQKAALDLDLFDLRYVETDLVRAQKLRSEEYIERLNTRVRERTVLVQDLDRALAAMEAAGTTNGESRISSAIDAAIRAQEEQFRQSAETTLIAPIDGVVTKVYRNAGENIAAGELLITISSEHSRNIVGFIRQPISVEPKVGDAVVVRTRRGTKRLAAEARIVNVGARLEFFTQPLRVRGFDSSQERGLPVLVSVPEGLTLYPGELVDLALKN
jgi:multidrug resistance efflux pump